MLRELRPSLRMLAVLTLLTGIVYPSFVALVARVAFAHAAGGSLIVDGGRVVGSEHLGQAFADSGRFWSRPSATGVPYDASASTGSNLGPLNADLFAAIRARVAALRAADPGNAAPVPADLVTASASGLDPDISPAAARYQAARIARVRGLSPARVHTLIAAHLEGRTFGVLGEERVNVLELNRALDQAAPRGASR
ncbi:MAG TPA: potassium-transporting ATPase subunit KdpC [Candidatus Acidoferrales bacterium]|nr:potassium-transporting ATPase subunit KdpC [Candidatus Acidoferrales bacterium]